MGALDHVLPTEKPISQAVAGSSKTIHHPLIEVDDWRDTGAAPDNLGEHDVAAAVTGAFLHHPRRERPRGGLLSGRRLSREPLLSARR